MHGTGTGSNQENAAFILLNQAVNAASGEITDSIGNESVHDRSFGIQRQNLAKGNIKSMNIFANMPLIIKRAKQSFMGSTRISLCSR